MKNGLKTMALCKMLNRVVAPDSVLSTSTFCITCHLQSANSMNKESAALKAEFTAMIEAAKSKMHQVRADE